MSVLGYPKFIPYTKFEHSGISFVFSQTILQTNRQTNSLKQTHSKILPTPTDIVGVGNYQEQHRVFRCDAFSTASYVEC